MSFFIPANKKRGPKKCGCGGGNNIVLSIEPTIWGPILWKELHTKSLLYDPHRSGDTNNFIKFLETLPERICEKCRPTLVEYYKENPYAEHMKTRYDLVYYIFNFHNFVNVKIDKKVISWEEFLDYYNPDYKTYKTLIPN